MNSCIFDIVGGVVQKAKKTFRANAEDLLVVIKQWLGKGEY